MKTIQSVGLVEFLLQNVSAPIIDHLWIDNEGPEYGILPMFLHGKAIAQAGIQVCQMNVEIHWPLENQGRNLSAAGELIRAISTNSDMVPLLIHSPINHQRAFFFNANSNYCINKYVPNWCPVTWCQHMILLTIDCMYLILTVHKIVVREKYILYK